MAMYATSLVAFAALLHGGDAATSNNGAQTDIIILGDSWAEGETSLTTPESSKQTNKHPESLLAKVCAGKTVVNRGVGGSTAREWGTGEVDTVACAGESGTVCTAASAFNPLHGTGYTHAWMSVGGNDFLGSDCSMTAETLANHVSTAVAAAVAEAPEGMKILMTGYGIFSEALQGSCEISATVALNAAIKAACETSPHRGRITFVDVMAEFGGSATTYSSKEWYADAIHLNNAGYTKMFSLASIQSFFGCSDSDGGTSGATCDEVPCVAGTETYSAEYGAIHIVGDSQLDGTGSTGGKFESTIAATLGTVAVNRAVGGSSLNQINAMESCASSLSCKWSVISGGMNLNEDPSGKTMEDFVERETAAGKKVIIVGYGIFTGMGEYVTPFLDAYTAIAKKTENVWFIDPRLDAVRFSPNYPPSRKYRAQDDGHPSPLAGEIFGNWVAELIKNPPSGPWAPKPKCTEAESKQSCDTYSESPGCKWTSGNGNGGSNGSEDGEGEEDDENEEEEEANDEEDNEDNEDNEEEEEEEEEGGEDEDEEEEEEDGGDRRRRGAGKCVEDVKVQTVTVANPSFENGKSGWTFKSGSNPSAVLSEKAIRQESRNKLMCPVSQRDAPVDGNHYASVAANKPITQATGTKIENNKRYTLKVWSRGTYQPWLGLGAADAVTARGLSSASLTANGNAFGTGAAKDFGSPVMKGSARADDNCAACSQDDGANIWFAGNNKEFRMHGSNMYTNAAEDPIKGTWKYATGNRNRPVDGMAIGPAITPGLTAFIATWYKEDAPLWSRLSIHNVKGIAPNKLTVDGESGEGFPDWKGLSDGGQASNASAILTNMLNNEDPWVMDAQTFYDTDSKRLWMTWGGHETYVTELNPNSGRVCCKAKCVDSAGECSTTDYNAHKAGVHTRVLSWDEIGAAKILGVGDFVGDGCSGAYQEGPALYKHAGKWFIFSSFGSMGEDYTIRVCRSTTNSPRGPYVDKTGRSCTLYEKGKAPGSSMLLGPEGEHSVPGHPHLWKEGTRACVCVRVLHCICICIVVVWSHL